VNYKYHQDPNFYYLTGHRQPHGLLMIFSEPQNINGQTMDEIIFVRGRNALAELYDGGRITTAEAVNELKLAVAFETPEFENFALDFSKFDQVLFYDFEDDVFGVSLPVYLASDSKGNLQSGVRLDWEDKDDRDIVFGVFVSSKFGIFDTP
jgi:hypothetical protein